MRANLDRELWRSGALVGGVDEAGRGALAGPVVAAAVVMPRDSLIAGVNDSKLLTPSARARLDREIRERALAWSVGLAGPRVIDRVNILNAALEAMARAIRRLVPRPDVVLVDGPHTPRVDINCRPVVGGDRLSYNVACASILAKVHRDRLMVRIGRRCPVYGFVRNKGYGTGEHLRALGSNGPSPFHRMSYAPVRECRV